jgi:hypothetical protein
LNNLKKAMSLLVTGTNVTAATVPEAQQGIASWGGLIKDGLNFCNRISESRENRTK